MNLKFINKDSDLILDKNFKISVSAYRRRVGIQKRFGKDGGVPTGDGRIDARDIDLSFNTISQTDEPYLTKLNELAGFFRPENEPFYLIDSDNNRRCEVAMETLSDRPSREGTELRAGVNKLELKMLDGHWEDAEENIVSPIGGSIANGAVLEVNNDSFVECYPVIKIRALSSNPDVTIRNETTKATTQLGSNNLVPGTEFIVDSQKGTVFLFDGISQVESSVALADGSGFIFLAPGENDILYESIFGNVELDVIFRRRYAF